MRSWEWHCNDWNFYKRNCSGHWCYVWYYSLYNVNAVVCASSRKDGDYRNPKTKNRKTL